MDSIDRLREWMENATAYGPSINGEFPRKHAAPWFGWKSDIEALIDAIEREVEDNEHFRREAEPFHDRLREAAGERADVTLFGVDYVALPMDAEGEPIHIGDVMETPDGETFEVSGIFYTAHEVMVDSVRFDYDPDEIIHHHAPTVEDVLAECCGKYHGLLVEAMSDYACDELPAPSEIIAEYAKRLRLAGDE